MWVVAAPRSSAAARNIDATAPSNSDQRIDFDLCCAHFFRSKARPPRSAPNLHRVHACSAVLWLFPIGRSCTGRATARGAPDPATPLRWT